MATLPLHTFFHTDRAEPTSLARFFFQGKPRQQSLCGRLVRRSWVFVGDWWVIIRKKPYGVTRKALIFLVEVDRIELTAS